MFGRVYTTDFSYIDTLLYADVFGDLLYSAIEKKKALLKKSGKA